jgi:hypothetical protein
MHDIDPARLSTVCGGNGLAKENLLLAARNFNGSTGRYGRANNPAWWFGANEVHGAIQAGAHINLDKPRPYLSAGTSGPRSLRQIVDVFGK